MRAELVVRETAILTPELQSEVDEELADGYAGDLGQCGDRELVRRVRAICYRLDAASVVNRCALAETNRRVTLRPAPDAMAYLTALLPVAPAVAAYASLTAASASAKAAGDPRSKGQVMADTLVARVTGNAGEGTGEPAAPAVEIQLVMTDRALLEGDDTPAHIPGYGSVPAAWARDLARDAAHAWVRRLYTHPADGTLVAMDSHRRTFTGGLRTFIVRRDGPCRTPLVRRSHRPDRPHPATRRRWPHDCGQRAGLMRPLQPAPRAPRLAFGRRDWTAGAAPPA